MDLLEQIANRPICGDGAMETLLPEREVATQECLEALCLTRPELVQEIHRAYLTAGARIVKTNSFGANSVQLARHGLSGRVNEINWQAAQLARQSAKGAFVAGSVGPLGSSSDETTALGLNPEDCFRVQIGALLDGGVHLIWLQGFADLEDLLLALRVKQSLHHCPAICSLAPNARGELSGGQGLRQAFAILEREDAEILGIDCAGAPQEALRLVEQLGRLELPLAVSANGGRVSYGKPSLLDSSSPQEFAEMGKSLAALGARIIGGGRGSTPSHIAALAGVLAAAGPD
jgi:methionine synthase / methylenetetrahydrofolate reductase(NADPH)